MFVLLTAAHTLATGKVPEAASTEFLPLDCLHNTTINTNTTDTFLNIAVVSYTSDRTLTAIANSSHHTS
ncbi:hypothetical protein CEP54_004667 [Fusarium duplospermum]|uniref:Uncharacterized protein n=1 Tax=Fusarium duplospermum TaxID=1325734 RepID=A0A428QGW5_9HYPO|nr:hypothetical protein CEP54_004667 [Fusarium duplospermum]